MSPTEHDLRNALHHGDGHDGLDIDRLIAGGEARRAARRVRIAAAAVAVAFVAVGVTGASLVLGNDNGGTDTANRQNLDRPAATPPDNGGQQATPGRSAPTRAASPTAGIAVGQCPSSLPRTLLPGRGSRTGGPLFAQPVVRLLVCAYGTKQQALDESPPPAPARLVLTGDSARRLTTSLQGAPTSSARLCQTVAAATSREFALVGVTAGGRTLRTVTLSLTAPACQSTATNGTAARYAWQPPDDLATLLRALTPRATSTPGTLAPPSGRRSASPIRS